MSVQWTDFEPRRGPVPVYRALAAFVRDAIEDGRLKSGDGFPGEQSIADATGVSVDTVRAAFAVLRDEGLIVTATGIGSFVA